MPSFCLTILYYIVRMFQLSRHHFYLKTLLSSSIIPSHLKTLDPLVILHTHFEFRLFKTSIMSSTHSSNPKTCGPPTRYYCCCCKFGPLSVAVDPACVNCHHWKCSGCNDEADTTVNLTVAPTASELVPTTKVFVVASSTSDYAIPHCPPTASEAAFCQGGLPGAGVTTNIHGLIFDEEANDGEYFTWYCCSCGDGPMGTANNAGCCECGHWRCKMCAVEGGK